MFYRPCIAVFLYLCCLGNKQKMFLRFWWLLWIVEHHEFLAENLREEKIYGLRRSKPKDILPNTVEKYPSPSDQGEYCNFKTSVIYLDSGLYS